MMINSGGGNEKKKMKKEKETERWGNTIEPGFQQDYTKKERQKHKLWYDHEAKELGSNNTKYGTKYPSGNLTGVIECSVPKAYLVERNCFVNSFAGIRFQL
jgi:hypothetical protein